MFSGRVVISSGIKWRVPMHYKDIHARTKTAIDEKEAQAIHWKHILPFDRDAGKMRLLDAYSLSVITPFTIVMNPLSAMIPPPKRVALLPIILKFRNTRFEPVRRYTLQA